ncbi:hypothetical protein DOY81_007531 [Sarcophaga bullata]|nr:hypothetical protein DOY81_007531 [Sarcophaga bullata]
MAVSKDEKISKKAVRIKSQDSPAPAVSTATTIPATIQLSPSILEQQQDLQTKKPSLLPKPKVKVVLPPALLQKQHQQQQRPQQEQQHEETENFEEGTDTETDAISSSRIPVRTANAEKRALLLGLTATSSPSGDTSASSLLSTSDTKKSKALINAEKRASWRAARLRSLEKGAVEAQHVIQNMTKIADDLLTEPLPSEQAKKIVFPKIAIKSSDGPIIIREREKILDEKIVRRTEEVPCPITGRPQLRTVEYIEKIIETEVETSREKIISLELQDPEKSETPNASLDLIIDNEVKHINAEEEEEEEEAEKEEHSMKQQIMLRPSNLASDAKGTCEENLETPAVTSQTFVETVERLHITKKFEDTDINKDRNTDISGRELEGNENDDDDDDNADVDVDEEDEETDSASIVTVQQNTEKLFLRNDDDEFPSIELDSLSSSGIFGPSSLDSVGTTSTAKVTIKPTTITMHQILAKEVVLPTTINTTVTTTTRSAVSDERNSCDNDVDGTTTSTTTTILTPITQSIVEVVNPLITGEGQVQRIAFSRSHHSEYPSFDNDDDDHDNDDDENDNKYGDNDDEDFENMPASLKVLRSETFVLPPSQGREELSLNAKMKNVLEELLENERVKYNLQKSLEESTNDADDTTKAGYGDGDDDDADEDNTDFAGINRTSRDNNGNQHMVNALIRDSNRNTLQRLQKAFEDDGDDGDDGDDDEDDVVEQNEEDDEEEIDEDEEESEESESSDSDDDEDDDDDDETIHITFVDGAKVIENFNTNTPLKLQKSQTYNTMKEAAEAMSENDDNQSKDSHSPDKIHHQDETQTTLEKLLAEQKKYAEISQQLRKSVENLLIDDEDIEATSTVITSTASTTKEAVRGDDHTHKPKTKRVMVTKKSSKGKSLRRDSIESETGEEIFNRLLEAGGSHKQMFDHETDETLTTSTTTCTDDNGTVITTTTTTISNITTSGIPRKVKQVETSVKTKKHDDNSDGDHEEP